MLGAEGEEGSMNSSFVSRKHVALSAALAMLLGACSSSGETGAGESGPPAVRVVADDASWETSGISDLRAGWVSFTMETREGEADHGLGLLRLQGDATVDELVQAESFEQFLELAEPIGGLVGVTGAATHTVTAHLDPGSYAIIVGASEARSQRRIGAAEHRSERTHRTPLNQRSRRSAVSHRRDRRRSRAATDRR
jgi:hypothetical protein